MSNDYIDWLTGLAGGRQRTRPPMGKLKVLKNKCAKDFQMSMALGSSVARSTVISANPWVFSNWDWHSLELRHVVDIRVAPSFHHSSLSSEEFRCFLEEIDITYTHLPALSNQFLGSSWNQALIYQDFVTYLQRQPEHLITLRKLIDNGPLLLLSSELDHEHSSRAAITDVLSDIAPGFDCLLA